MAGNVWEWTMEIYNTTSLVFRGGRCLSYCYERPASNRIGDIPTGTDKVYSGFRPALYLKIDNE